MLWNFIRFTRPSPVLALGSRSRVAHLRLSISRQKRHWWFFSTLRSMKWFSMILPKHHPLSIYIYRYITCLTCLNLYLQSLGKVGALFSERSFCESHQVTPLAPSDASVPCPRHHDLCWDPMDPMGPVVQYVLIDQWYHIHNYYIYILYYVQSSYISNPMYLDFLTGNSGEAILLWQNKCQNSLSNLSISNSS